MFALLHYFNHMLFLVRMYTYGVYILFIYILSLLYVIIVDEYMRYYDNIVNVMRGHLSCKETTEPGRLLFRNAFWKEYINILQ